MTLSGAPRLHGDMASSRSRQVLERPAVDHLKEHLLIGDGVHQPVGAQQEKVPWLPLHTGTYPPARWASGPRARVMRFRLGWRRASLRREIALLHHILHQGVVPGDLADALSADVIGPAVADVR